MSYDIEIVEVKHSSNYTFNIYEMFTKAMEQLVKENLLPDYYSRWTDVLEHNNNSQLKLLIKELKTDPEKYKKYNPKNGWGSYDTGLKWLEEIAKNWKDNYKVIVYK